ncbi:transcriptional regulator PpsR [Albimonas sp. CAU 1670]|uniref:transcriptional regulator PpsR n=1 Tax=Albimonas sp. CAU 1670 TaxID=3032599 RepID=UPI0023DB3984|nr:transcriptional regulator PpsR [Albimonas sp. CAU 1670]MDF2231516.1 transcriptional regulator PpsR [Albimonas sp. CAU 1670]
MSHTGSPSRDLRTLADLPSELVAMALSAAGDVVLVLDDERRVLSALLGADTRAVERIELSHWRDRPLEALLTEESRPKLDKLLAEAAAGGPRRARELNHIDGSLELPMRYIAFRIDQRFLLVGRDLRPMAELQRKLVRAQLALEQDYERFREYETRYRVLLETSREALVLVEAESGRVRDLNPAAERLLGVSGGGLNGAALSSEFEDRSRDAFAVAANRAVETGEPQSVAVRSRRGFRALTVDAQLFRAGGEALLLCRLFPEEAPGGVSSEFGTALADLFHKGGDAIVLTDATGRIETANEAFLNLVDVAVPRELRGMSFADFLERPAVDLSVMTEQAMRTGRLSGFGTRLRTRFGAVVSVDISTTHLSGREPLAFAFVIRDLSRHVGAREPGPSVDGEAMQNVIDLVGSAPLKELVAATADVVERMCIETAVQLTNNNRAAAAEMLGLSRQSLYVKLRKYNLIGRSDDA